MTTASKITMARVIMVPIFMVIVLLDFSWSRYAGLAVFIVASITDAVDGYVARNFNQITNFGKFIDPLADKLLVTAAILIFIELEQMPAWAGMIIITREFAVTGLRMVAALGNRVIAAGISGKIKTVTSIVAICIMLTPLYSLKLGPVSVNTVCVAAMVITTIWSGVEYFIQNMDVLDMKS